YFRHPFVVPQGTVITNLNFRVAQAHGVAVWLNGREVYRTNLSAGPISYTNLASSTFSYYPRYIFNSTNVPVNLTAGTNWIGAEVHLGSVTNSSMGFDMELIGIGYPLYFGSLQLSAPSAANEGDGLLAGVGGIILSAAPTNDLLVSLKSSDTNGVTVTSSVVI